MSTLLLKFVGAGLWESEDAAGRLGLVAHAAFLHAGFVPYGAEPPSGHLLKRAGNTASSFFLSRLYTAPELAHREGAEAAVLMLCGTGGGGAALLMYLTADGGDMWCTYRQGLDAAAMASLFSSRLEDTESWGSRICKWLAEIACGGLLAELCRRNGLPQTGFTSLPEDVVVEILKRITGPEDLASMASTSWALRHLVVEECKNQLRKETWAAWPWHYLDMIWSFARRAPPSPPAELHDVLPEPENINMARRSKAEGHHRKDVSRRNDCRNKGRRAAGAIHSPSSRYRWKHR
ncbi:unnamed protein product [Urochloa decumbens]|uniref:F-box domain-containing protein n=1 Tax=Urochloa decumbens TaxID=240449 RepID=A0ABC8XZ02_9POAL